MAFIRFFIFALLITLCLAQLPALPAGLPLDLPAGLPLPAIPSISGPTSTAAPDAGRFNYFGRHN